MKQTIAILLLLLWVEQSSADRVLKIQFKKRLVAISLDEGKTLEPDAQVCAMVQDVSLACGDVFLASESGIILYVYHGIENVSPGQVVEVTRRRAIPNSRLLLLGNIMKFPRVEFQQLISKHLTYGILTEGILHRAGVGSVKGFGALMTGNYYSGGAFQGIWLMMGLGMHIVNNSDTGDETSRTGVTSMLAHASLGFRFRFSDFSFAVAGGGQYFLDKSLHAKIGNSGVLPVLMADVGYLF